MQVLLLAVMAALAPFVVCYDEAFDKIDIDKILGDDAMFVQYINCMLDKGPCDLEHSAEFKSEFE
jgi:hypothetical protein